METNNDITIIGETNFRNQNRKFGIKPLDRTRHLYIIGKTGTGKTTLSENMAIQDIQRGNGLAVIDPHGEFAENVLNFVPASRINDVIYFNPADLEYPIAFNAIEKVDAEYRHLVASGLMGVFKKIWPDVWSARMEYILHNTILALLEYPGSTLLGINRMLADKDYRKKVVEKISDSSVKSFWINEFAKYPDKFREEAVAPIQNKVGQFISSPLIRNIIGQTKSSVDFRQIMDEKKIFIVNLSKGRIGEDASRLLGALCITKLQLAAMSRVDIPEKDRVPFYLYVDEFQNFATESFANILSEARKYQLSLILAHQYIDQLVQGENTVVKDAVFGNVGTMVTFRVGAADAEFLEPEYEPEFEKNDLINLGFAQIYIKLMIDGMSSRPFSANTLAPPPRPEKINTEKIIKVSRERYASARAEVEEKIAKWSGVIEAEKTEKKNYETPRDSVRLYEDICWECGKRTQLNFKPDGERPVFCKDCLAKKNQGSGQAVVDRARKTVSAPRPANNSRKFSPTTRGTSRGASGTLPVIRSGEEVVRQPAQDTISLADVVKKELVYFGNKKPAQQKPLKKEIKVDMNALRNSLKEALNKQNDDNGDEKK
jgi:CxxC-x17-CxxC domain-containing protein